MAKWLKWVLGILGVGGAAYGANELHKHKFFNKDGYNRLGRDRDGRDRDGYDIHGYNREGRDREGSVTGIAFSFLRQHFVKPMITGIRMMV